MPNRTEMLHFRATPEEKERIKENAGHAEVALSTWMRARSLSYGEGDFERVLEELAPTQPPVEEPAEPLRDFWPPADVHAKGETYVQFMERRVGELVGKDAGPEAQAQARKRAYDQWINRELRQS